MNRFLMVFAFTLFGSAPAHCQPPTIAEIAELQAVMASTKESSARLAILDRLEARGELDYQAGEDVGQVRLRLAANAFYREGQLERSAQIHRRIALCADSALDIARSHRMIGQIHSDMGQWSAASQAYMSSIELLLQDPAALADRPRELESAVRGAESTLVLAGDRERAARVALVLLREDLRGLVSEKARQWALKASANNLTRIGDHQRAFESWNRLLNEYPVMGLQDGSRVELLRMRAGALKSMGDTEGYLNALLNIWNDKALVQFLGTARVGNQLAHEYQELGWIHEARDMSASVVSQMVLLEQSLGRVAWQSDWKNEARLKTAINRTIELAAETRDYATAYWAATLQRDRYDTTDDRSGQLLADRYERLHYASHRLP